ncbi:MAG: chloride channel protein [Clostridiales bacterium]|nr:chloride channel protein [Clostridiales bacterium]
MGIFKFLLKKSILAILLGVIASLAGMLLLIMIKTSSNYFSKTNNWFVYPLIGAVLLMIVRKYLLRDNIEFGMDEVKDEINNIDYRIMNIRDTIVKSMLTFITLAFGFSAGKFGPLIHVGGSIGSDFAYRLKLDKEDIKYFIGAGVAATLSGFFSNPLFGILFVVEILFQYRINWRSVYIVLSAFIALGVSKIIVNNCFFYIEHFKMELTIEELFIRLAVIGIATGFLSSLYKIMLEKAKRFIKENEKFYFPLIAGIIMSVIGYFYPQIFDVYVDINHVAIEGNLLFQTVLILLLLKFIATGVTFAFGGVGGGFGPAIYIGTLIGYSVSLLGLPSSIGNVLGMVGMMAGYSNAPIATAALFAGIMENNSLFIPFLTLGILSSHLSKIIFKKITSNR